MDAVWESGEGCVRDVVERLQRPLAYTTVMTTLDRLFKKKLLYRRKEERAFVYAPRFSKAEWEQQQAESVWTGMLSGGAHELLVSTLVDAVGEHDPALLDALEAEIRRKREELKKGEEEAR